MLDTLDKRLTLQERVRIVLNSYHDREPQFLINDLAKKVGEDESYVYQALWRLRKAGEIEILKTHSGSGNSLKISGARLLKMETTSKIYYRSAQSRKLKQPSNSAKRDEEMEPSFPELTAYIHKKNVVEKAKENLLEAGLDPNIIIHFETDPISEEACNLLLSLKEVTERLQKLQKEHQTLSWDYQAAKRDIEYLKEKVKEETKEELLDLA